MTQAPNGPLRRCDQCGASLPAADRYCASCGAVWRSRPLGDDISSLVALLTTVEDWRREGLVDSFSYQRLRASYEARLAELRPDPPAPPAVAAGVGGRRDGPPSAPPFDLGAWAARRQADVLLYLGAFLLVVAAVIFVTSQGETLSPLLRVALLFAYTAAFIVVGIAVPRWTRVREAGPVFLALGALLTPLDILVLYVEVFSDRGVPREWVWLAGSAYSAVFYGLLFARGYGRLYAIPAVIALGSTWAALAATVELPIEWLGAWWMAAATLVAAAGVASGRLRGVVFAASIAIAVVALAFAQLAADSEHHHAQLPVAYALLTAGVAITGWGRREPWMLLLATTTATVTVISVLWASGAGPAWSVYPVLAAGALLVATRPLWARWSSDVARVSWGYAGLCGLAPLVWPGFVDAVAGPLTALFSPDPFAASWHGAAAGLLGAALLGAIAWRNTAGGFGTSVDEPGGPTPPLERVLFGWGAFAVLLVAVAHAQGAAGVERPDTGWAFAVIGVAVVAALALTARREAFAVAALLPPLALVTLASLQPWDRTPGHDAVLLALPAVTLALASAVTRRWTLAAASAVFAGAAMAAAWDALHWQPWTLAAAYAAAGLALFAILTTRRRYRLATEPDAERIATLALSWGFLVASPIAAATLVGEHWGGGVAEAAATAEYRTMVVALALLAPLIVFESRRLHRWAPSVAALAVIALAAAAARPALEWPAWTLGATYAAAGIVLFATVTPWRRYADDDEDAVAVLALSWGMPLAALLVAFGSIEESLERTAIVRTAEYRVLLGSVLLFAPLIAFEGRRLRERALYIPATAVAMVAVVMAVAIARPENVQAYTVPVSLYLGAVGLIVRRSPVLVRPHMMLHELVLLLGTAMLVLPQIEQGLSPGGTQWAIVLLAEGAIFLAVAFLLNARWLVVSGVLTMSAVAVRSLLVSGDVVPYWLTLGLAGLLLLGGGVLLLLQREWWERVRAGASRWWDAAALVGGHAGLEIPAPALLSAVAPSIAVLLATAGGAG